jgi:hypothetical protein
LNMEHLFKLLLISFLLQTIGYYSLRKELKKSAKNKVSKAIKVGMGALAWGIAMQLFVIIALAYLYFFAEFALRSMMSG